MGTVGILASLLSLDLAREGATAKYVRVLAELTLAMVLFVDASTINLKRLVKESKLPIRLLGIGLPLTMIAGALIAILLFPEERTLALILMALILSPTDAALGLAVVTSPIVPEKIRQTINVESGLNDGIALPPILICLALLSHDATDNQTAAYWMTFVLKQFAYGPVIGGLVGWLGGLLIEAASKRNWMNHSFQQLASVSLAILGFTLAESVDGNGFIAAFFTGLFLGTNTEHVKDRIRGFGEAASQAMALFIFLLFGLILVPISFPLWDWQSVVYALLSLTVIRMVPVAISLAWTELDRVSITFIGWFGPRGIASVLYLLLMVLALGKEGNEKIVSIITLTVLLSVFLHGITAVPFSKWFESK